MAETPEDQRASLIDRIAALIHETFVPDPANRFAPRFTCYDESAEAVLSLLESGRAGVWLVPAVGVLDTVGVVITQLRDAKTELVEARAEVERLRADVEKFSSALDVMHAQQLRTEDERDDARDELERLRGALFPDGWPCPNPDDPEGCYCPGDGPCLADPRTGE